MAETGIKDLAAKAIDKLELSPPVREILGLIHSEVAAAYRSSFLEMIEVIRRQASSLDRIQNTLHILVKHLSPDLAGQLPAAIRAIDGETEPDLATAFVVADPIGAGYTLTQGDIAKALTLSEPDVSILVRAFKLPDDGKIAVIVRKGKTGRNVVNYHPKAIERFRALVAKPPSGLSSSNRRLVERVRAKLVLAGGTGPV